MGKSYGETNTQLSINGRRRVQLSLGVTGLLVSSVVLVGCQMQPPLPTQQVAMTPSFAGQIAGQGHSLRP